MPPPKRHRFLDLEPDDLEALREEALEAIDYYDEHPLDDTPDVALSTFERREAHMREWNE
jgi:hypothetical protein